MVAALVTGAIAATALFGAQPQAMAQAGCTDKTAPASVLAGRDVDIYSTEGRFIRSAPAAEFGATVAYIDCGDVRYVGIAQGSDMVLIRRTVIAPPPPTTVSCYCPGPGSNQRSKTFGAPGIATAQQCPAAQCATR